MRIWKSFDKWKSLWYSLKTANNLSGRVSSLQTTTVLSIYKNEFTVEFFLYKCYFDRRQLNQHISRIDQENWTIMQIFRHFIDKFSFPSNGTISNFYLYQLLHFGHGRGISFSTVSSKVCIVNFNAEMKKRKELRDWITSFHLICRWPFDWKKPLGYFMAWIMHSATVLTTSLSAILLFNFILESCWFFIVMVEDIGKDFTIFNNKLRVNSNRKEWMKRFCDIIQFLSDAKQ